MSVAKDIKSAIVRTEKKLRQRPSIGQLTKLTTARVEKGLTCEIHDGDWSLTADMRKSLGGNEEGPDPGVFGRAALSSCLAIGYATWFARLGVPLNSVEVEVEAEFDYGGVLGVAETSPGYSAIRYVVVVESPASENAILQALDVADDHSPWLANLRLPLEPLRTVRILESSE